ncbi:MAG: EthD domain-containing protein [Dehalococcoidia bacterium]|nr:EthD domain-containing protein [Dehalococcoidia bacterium]
MIRLVYFLRRDRGMSLDDFHRYLRDIRGPLLAGHSTDLHIRRCVHSYFAELPQDEGARKGRGAAEPYDALEEIWFDSPEEAAVVFESDEGRRAAAELVRDESQFVDFARSSLWFAIELPQINPTPENIVAREETKPIPR